MKKTKIIATVGPASHRPEVLREMVQEGVNVCRINFSHGSHADHLNTIQIIREMNASLGVHIAILADLQGPKIRIGEVAEDGVELQAGSLLTIVTEACLGTRDRVQITYGLFPRDVKTGDVLLVDDGKLKLEVVTTDGRKEVVTKVINGGVLRSRKGVNLPDTAISMPSLTDKDKEDLHFALQQDVDWIGLSFVRSAEDIVELKALIARQQKHAKVIAKIEKPEAVDDIDRIVRETDAVMIARGDLGVEIPMEKIPLLQKRIIKMCRKYAKPTIVATQMMESMMTSFAPTRAEVNDVANAVIDGADAVMLSGETSVGRHPVTVIKAMRNIIREAETDAVIYHKEEFPEENQSRFITDSICFNAARLAKRTKAAGIITMTFSGYTAYKVASQRPKADIYVFTENRRILTQLNLLWGVKGFFYDRMISTDHTIEDCKEILQKRHLLEKGALVINIASTPIEEKGPSNMVKLSYV